MTPNKVIEWNSGRGNDFSIYRLCSACVHVHVVSTHVLTFCPTPSMNVVAEGSRLNACICMFAPPPGIVVAVLGEEQWLRGASQLRRCHGEC